MAGTRACGPSEPDMDDYRAESDHHTLTRAQEVQTDPKRMAGVRKYHAKQVKALTKVGRTIGSKRSPGGGGR